MKYGIFIVLIASIFSCIHANEAFKVNKVERALINPKGTLEATALLYSTLNNNRENENDSYLNISYSLSKNIELIFLGANYLFYNNKSSDYLVGARFIGGSRNNAGKNEETAFELKFKGKNRFSNNRYALEYHALYTHVFNSAFKDGYTAEFLIEPIMSINDYLSVSLSARFIHGENEQATTLLNKYSDTDYYDIGCNAYININKYIELYVNYVHFNSTNPSFPPYDPYGHDFYNKNGDRIGFGGSFRFFFN